MAEMIARLAIALDLFTVAISAPSLRLLVA
jgi:hypothetical protein